MSERVCDFCKTKESHKNPLIAGNNVCICKNCIIASYSLLMGGEQHFEEESGSSDSTELSIVPPKELKAVLDEYVIGQEKAKKVFSVAVSLVGGSLHRLR